MGPSGKCDPDQQKPTGKYGGHQKVDQRRIPGKIHWQGKQDSQKFHDHDDQHQKKIEVQCEEDQHQLPFKTKSKDGQKLYQKGEQQIPGKVHFKDKPGKIQCPDEHEIPVKIQCQDEQDEIEICGKI